MSDISSVVSANIERQTASISQAGFGTEAIATYHTRDAGRLLIFTSAASMLQANGGPHLSTDAAYILGSKAFSQSPGLEKLYSFRRLYPTIRTVNVFPKSGTFNGQVYPINSYPYAVTVGGETFTYTSDASATIEEISAGLVALINAGGTDVKATDNGASFTVQKAASPGGSVEAGEVFSFVADRTLFNIEDATPVASGGTLTDEIAGFSSVNDSWYALTGDWYGKTEILEAAAAIEAQKKIYIAACSDTDILDLDEEDDVCSVLQNSAYDRTACFHHTNPEAGIASAFLGRNLPSDPGSITWRTKTLAGIAAVDYTATEIAALESKNAGHYVTIAGTNVTKDGAMASGEWIDTMRFVDWLQARIEEEIFLTIKNLPKVPYTNTGIGIIENALRGVLSRGQTVGGLTTDTPFTVTVPNAIVGSTNGVSATDKANRLLPDMNFVAYLAGAVHKVEVNGKVTI